MLTGWGNWLWDWKSKCRTAIRVIWFKAYGQINRWSYPGRETFCSFATCCGIRGVLGVIAGDWMRVPPEMAGAPGLLQSGLRWQSQVSLCSIWFVGHFLNSLGFRISSVSRIETWLITQAEIGTYYLGVMLAALINRYNISCSCNNPFSRWFSSMWKDLETWAPSSCGFVIP